jgi:ferritin-like metal-binding protein YciE
MLIHINLLIMKNKQKSEEQNQRKQTPSTEHPSQDRQPVKLGFQSNKKTQSATGTKDSSTKNYSPKNGDLVGLRDLFESQLQDIYYAEKTLSKTIPKMIQKSSSEELADVLSLHLNATKHHITRCEEVFSSMNMNAAGKKCDAIDGLLKEANEIIDSAREGSVRDAGIICAAQKVEHYEIASYGTLAAFARQLGALRAASLLEDTLAEEKQADQLLTEIAVAHINEAAERIYH